MIQLSYAALGLRCYAAQMYKSGFNHT